MSDNLPWHRQEIFHDEIAKYPLVDFFPLQPKPVESKEESETSWDEADK
ncbi:MAG: hypothetical protein GX197_03675 [Firmicutes bacterium]|nr:hypothetical protein [Bacillota bacterium]